MDMTKPKARPVEEVLRCNDWVEWWEPYSGTHPDGSEATVPVQLRVRAEAAVLMQRKTQVGEQSAIELLEEFIAVHWARVLDAEGHRVEVVE